jgi:hypothetical protein
MIICFLVVTVCIYLPRAADPQTIKLVNAMQQGSLLELLLVTQLSKKFPNLLWTPNLPWNSFYEISLFDGSLRQNNPYHTSL